MAALPLLPPEGGPWGNWKLECQQFAQRGPLGAPPAGPAVNSSMLCPWPTVARASRVGAAVTPWLCCFGESCTSWTSRPAPGPPSRTGWQGSGEELCGLGLAAGRGMDWPCRGASPTAAIWGTAWV